MKPSPSSENDEQDRELIEILKKLGQSTAAYPPDRLAARRAAFLAQVEQLTPVEPEEELSSADQKIVKLLEPLKSAPAEYPANLLAARRSAFLSQIETAGRISLLDRLRTSLQSLFPSKTTPTLPSTGLRRMSLVLAGLLAAVILWSLFLPHAELSSRPLLSQAAGTPTHILPTSTRSVTITICKPGDQTSSCTTGALNPSPDLADQRNGSAQPAVSKDAWSASGGVYKAAYVNDGRGGASWVSNSADSWIKIDLGKVRTINTVSLQKGSLGTSNQNNPGQFVIAVALSDVYADGNSSNDYTEYAQVFHSGQTGFRGAVSDADTIQAQFPAVKARFVKITFEKAGTAIDEVGVFLKPPPVAAEQPTSKPKDEVPGTSSTPLATNTPFLLATATALPTNTPLPADTYTSVPTLTNTPPPDTSTPLPTDTSTPIPTVPLPSDTPIPLPTLAPPTAIPAIIASSPASSGTIIVTGNDQTLTFTCNGDAVEIRGYTNTVTLLGSCSSITVTGNGNLVFWQFGSPVITNQGKDNVLQQL